MAGAGGAVFAAQRSRLEQQPRKGAGRVQQVGISWKLRRPAASSYLLSLVSETARTHGGRRVGKDPQRKSGHPLRCCLRPDYLESAPPTPSKPPGYFRNRRQVREQAHPRSQDPGPGSQAGLQSTARRVSLRPSSLFCHPPTAPSQMLVGQRSPFVPRTQIGALHTGPCALRDARAQANGSLALKRQTGQPAGRGWARSREEGWRSASAQPGASATFQGLPQLCFGPPSEGFHGTHGFYTPTPPP